jgi:hypothetical protein
MQLALHFLHGPFEAGLSFLLIGFVILVVIVYVMVLAVKMGGKK